ncbi:hypothetical protein [Luteibacter sp. 3190]|uniref:hypothetical protein n=1 Tax=Luteibacter sp. 3190 TaxID=2817736 RepID=UPI00285C3692|nr:hypothetical protein [Luteibacter sp. 3190]MDR6935714.1 hypothetical protein [Luteibacter sp. 3190]
MSTVTWYKPSSALSAPLPQIYGAAENGLPFVMIRGLASSTQWRVSLFPGGDRDASIEARAGSERQAKRMVERWAACRRIEPKPMDRTRRVSRQGLPPRKPKGAEDRS